MEVNANPCLPCAECCSLKGDYGLRLSKDEFDTYFKDKGEGLIVRVENGIYILSSKEGLVCPLLKNGSCQIYLDRPIDCRLYPYQMELVYETKNKVKFVMHHQSNCSKLESFLYDEAEARKLIAAFGKKVYGSKKIIVQKLDNSFWGRVKNRLELLFVKTLS